MSHSTTKSTPSQPAPELPRWTSTWNIKFGPAIWVNDRIFARIVAGVEMSTISPEQPIAEWQRHLNWLMDAIREKQERER